MKREEKEIIRIGDVEFKVLFPDLLPRPRADERERLSSSIKDIGVETTDGSPRCRRHTASQFNRSH